MNLSFSNYKFPLLVLVLFLDIGQTVYSQHEGHQMPASKPAATPSPSPSPTPVPKGGPEQTHVHTPGMVMPDAQASPSPSGSPQPADTDMPGMNMPSATASPAVPETMDMSGMNSMKPMNIGPLLVMTNNDMGIRVGGSKKNVMPMGQMGSGTSWQPATTPQQMIHKQSGDWLLMFHYNAIAGVNSQGGPRGVTKFESANWFMPMAFRKVGPGTLQLRGMFSFEPFTFPRGGSPLLFQTGETYKGQPLIDRQHPHELSRQELSLHAARVGG